MKEKEWTVAEKVEERPGDEDGEEDDHGDRVPEEAEEEDKERDKRLVHTKVIEVALDAGGGFAECVRAREGGEWLDELVPWRMAKMERTTAALAVVVDVEGSVL